MNPKSSDAEKIGLYSAMTSVIEVTLGATLKSLRIPFKGTFLAYLQNFMLILFGKNLNGRGLIWIALITAGMKSFSPIGGKLRPMIYIFLQGFFFVLPSWILGWNFLSVLLGSIFLGWCTLFLSLGLQYILFGISVIESYVNAFNKITALVHLEPMSFYQILLIGLIIKSSIAPIIAGTAYFFDFNSNLAKLENKIKSLSIKKINIEGLKTPTWQRSISLGFKDILSKFYFIPFIFISLIIFFFSDISKAQYFIIMIRALVISWFGFVLTRKIDFLKIINFFRKRQLDHVAEGIMYAIEVVESVKNHRKKAKGRII